MWFLFEICSYSFKNHVLHLQVKVIHCSTCRWQNRSLASVQELVKLFCSSYWQNPPLTATVHYFHCNSHHHYHFNYHCKMLLYCLKILRTIPLCNMIPCLFQLNFILFLSSCIFSSFFPRRFLRPVKGLKIHLQPLDVF